MQRDLSITARLTGQDTGSLVAIFSITATITNLITFATRRDRSYIVLPNQLTVNQKDLPPTKKRTNQMLRGPHHNSRVRKTPQPTLKLLQKMKPTQTGDQKPRKLQTSNQLSVLLPLVNEADTYRTNLSTIGKIEACSCKGGYCCTPFSY